MRLRFLFAALALPASAGLAHAHGGHDVAYGFSSGLLHPLTGADHLVAMLAVGAWAALLGGKSRLALPAAFVTAMLAGSGLAAAGGAFALVEHAVLASLIVLGLMIAVVARPPTLLAAMLVAAFGAAHGYAHGLEAPSGQIHAFTAGFVLSTIALHVLGLAGGTRLLSAAPMLALRLAGAGAASVGLALAYAQ